MAEELKELIEDIDNRIIATDDVLARSWRLLLKVLRVNPERIKFLISNHGRIRVNFQDKNKVENFKGNISRTLAEDTLSWSTFIHALVIMNYYKTILNFSFTRGETELPYNVDIKTVAGLSFDKKIFTMDDMDDNIQTLKPMWDAVRSTFAPGDALNLLVREYVDTLSEKGILSSDKLQKDYERTKVRKKLLGDNMTWKSFAIGLRVCKLDKMVIGFHLVSTRTITFNLKVELQ